MKKISKLLVFLLSLTMIFSGVITFAACGGETEECKQHVDANSDGRCDICGAAIEKEPDPEPEVHVCSFVCPVCDGCLDEPCEDPVCATKCGSQSGRELMTFEGEDEHVELKGGSLGNLGHAKEEEYGATETYVSNFNANVGASIKYSLTAEADGKANLIVSVCKRQATTIFTNVVAVLVNGEMLDRPSRVPSNGRTEDTWTEFVDVNLGCIDLVEGRNVIEFSIMDAGAGSGYNFNAMRLKTDTAVTWYEGGHVCDNICSSCGKCNDYACTDPLCADKCEEDWEAYAFDGLDDKVEVSGGAFKNDEYIGGLNGVVDAAVTFNVNVEVATFASININSCFRPSAATFNQAFKLLVNNVEVKSDAALPVGGTEWSAFENTKVGYAKLKVGKNVIKLIVTSDDVNVGRNLKGISVGTAETEVNWYVDKSVVDYRFEAENADSNGWAGDKLIVSNNDNASAGKCVGRVYDVSLAEPNVYYLSFDVYAAEATEATLYIGVSAAGSINTNAFPIKVNDQDKTVDKGIPQSSWDDFQEVEYNAVSLNAGKNTIVMTIGNNAIGNIDYIGFVCDVELNGGTPDPEVPQSYKFEAENADSNAWPPVDQLWKCEKASSSGGWHVGHVNDASQSNPGEYYLSFDVYAAEAGEVTLYLGLGIPNSISSNAFPLELNGEAVTVAEKTITSANNEWEVFVDYEFAVLSFEAGKNTVKISIGSGAECNIDYISFTSSSLLTSTPQA